MHWEKEKQAYCKVLQHCLQSTSQTPKRQTKLLFLTKSSRLHVPNNPQVLALRPSLGFPTRVAMLLSWCKIFHHLHLLSNANSMLSCPRPPRPSPTGSLKVSTQPSGNRENASAAQKGQHHLFSPSPSMILTGLLKPTTSSATHTYAFQWPIPALGFLRTHTVDDSPATTDPRRPTATKCSRTQASCRIGDSTSVDWSEQFFIKKRLSRDTPLISSHTQHQNDLVPACFPIMSCYTEGLLSVI